jgi:hypothetical protein
VSAGYVVEVRIGKKWRIASLHPTKAVACFTASGMFGARLSRVRHVRIEAGSRGVVWEGAAAAPGEA